MKAADSILKKHPEHGETLCMKATAQKLFDTVVRSRKCPNYGRGGPKSATFLLASVPASCQGLTLSYLDRKDEAYELVKKAGAL